MTKGLTDADIARAAGALDTGTAVVRAILAVEAPRGGFQADGQVSILFEPHKFSQYTNGRFDKSHPQLSYPRWKPGAYGTYASQHPKLQRAAALDREAALKAASWGIPQILGSNWKQAGASSLQDFMNRMHRSEGAQLDLMVNFIKNDPELLAAIQARDWHTIARKYNGTGYRQNSYHTKLADAYDAHVKAGTNHLRGTAV